MDLKNLKARLQATDEKKRESKKKSDVKPSRMNKENHDKLQKDAKQINEQCAKLLPKIGQKASGQGEEEHP